MALRQPPPVTLCDQDGQEADVTRWSVTDPDGRVVDLDLCAKHDKPLRTLMSKGILRLTPEQQRVARGLNSRVRGLPPPQGEA